VTRRPPRRKLMIMDACVLIDFPGKSEGPLKVTLKCCGYLPGGGSKRRDPCFSCGFADSSQVLHTWVHTCIVTSMQWVEWPMVRTRVEDSGKGRALESFRGSCGKGNFSWEGMASFHSFTASPPFYNQGNLSSPRTAFLNSCRF
jgi:hypothetical protein